MCKPLEKVSRIERCSPKTDIWPFNASDLFEFLKSPWGAPTNKDLSSMKHASTVGFASHSLQSDQTSTSQSTGHSREMSDAVVFFERWAYLCNLLNCMLQLQSILDKSLHSAPVEQLSWSSSCFRRRNLHYISLLPICLLCSRLKIISIIEFCDRDDLIFQSSNLIWYHVCGVGCFTLHLFLNWA